MNEKVRISKLRSGVRGLDEVLGGGLPEYSFNLIAGGPGCGKTTLAHQILFANASPETPALYISVVGEPAVKMLRYQQQYSFFDGAKIPGCVRFLHLGESALVSGLEEVLQTIIREVENTRPALVIVDSFRSLFDQKSAAGQLDVHRFVQRLSLHLTSWQATTFLVGEYPEEDAGTNPVFTVADGIIWLTQSLVANSVVRKLQVVKMRGQAEVPGLHTFRISSDGLTVFPRLPTTAVSRRAEAPGLPKSTGILGLDEMLSGGIPRGHSALVVGPSGSGKTMLSTQFLLDGARNGENSVVALFERRPEDWLHTAPFSAQLQAQVAQGRMTLLYLRPLDLSVEEALEAVRQAVIETKAERLVIDSLSGLELALAPAFRTDFREALYRMMSALRDLGVTSLMTAELDDRWTELRLSPHGVSFLTDALILQRYVELEGRLRKVLTVVKMRGSEHSTELREYRTRQDGIVVGDPLRGYEGILAGRPRPGTAGG